MEFSYINKSFSDYSATLVELAKTYFPNSYTDFSEESIGKMFFDLLSMTGDTLSFYSDTQLSENLLLYTKEKKNIFAIAYQLGYKPKVTTPSIAKLTVYQQVPSNPLDSYKPDYSYCVLIEGGSNVVGISNGQSFYIQDTIDFSINLPNSVRTEKVYLTDSSGHPTYYLLSKEVLAVSGQLKTTDFVINGATKYLNLDLIDENIIEIVSVIDSDGNKWYEVDNLAQDIVFDDFKDSNGYYNLQLNKVQRRFVSRFRNETTLQLEFGSGTNTSVDEIVVLNSKNVGLNTINGISKMNNSYDITDFMSTNTYGIAPRNTTLTVSYLVGGGSESNVESNTLRSISTSKVVQNSTLDSIKLEYVLNSISCNNSEPATGGSDGDTVEEIRLNALSNYTTQNRIVTQTDYIIRCLSLPSKYGSISKVFVENKDGVVNLYTLGYDINNTMTVLNSVTKTNLKTYLSRHTDDKVLIRDAFVINFKLFYDITVLPTYNSNEVLTNCSNKLKDFFAIDKWNINQPILITDIYTELLSVKGVQSIVSIKLENVSGDNYSIYSYDFTGATRNNVIYPPVDKSIFEIKYPNTDIKGRVTTY